ncbi:MAG: hypothetical protein AB7T49_06885 [Oligoflexales bacterium]
MKTFMLTALSKSRTYTKYTLPTLVILILSVSCRTRPSKVSDEVAPDVTVRGMYQGYDSVTHELKETCVDGLGGVSGVDGGLVRLKESDIFHKFEVKQNATVNTLSSLLSANLGGTGSAPGLKFGASFGSEFTSSAKDLTDITMVSSYYRKRTEQNTDDLTIRPIYSTDIANGNFSNIRRFCGDSFISTAVYGGFLMATVKVEYASNEERQKLEGAADGSLLDFDALQKFLAANPAPATTGEKPAAPPAAKPAADSANATAEEDKDKDKEKEKDNEKKKEEEKALATLRGDIKKIDKKMAANTKISIKVEQIGGNTSIAPTYCSLADMIEYVESLGGSAPESAPAASETPAAETAPAVDNGKACMNSIAGVLAYASKFKESLDGDIKNLGVLVYAETKPYSALPSSGALYPYDNFLKGNPFEYETSDKMFNFDASKKSLFKDSLSKVKSKVKTWETLEKDIEKDWEHVSTLHIKVSTLGKFNSALVGKISDAMVSYDLLKSESHSALIECYNNIKVFVDNFESSEAITECGKVDSYQNRLLSLRENMLKHLPSPENLQPINVESSRVYFVNTTPPWKLTHPHILNWGWCVTADKSGEWEQKECDKIERHYACRSEFGDGSEWKISDVKGYGDPAPNVCGPNYVFSYPRNDIEMQFLRNMSNDTVWLNLKRQSGWGVDFKPTGKF